jgi:hypothetical protein
MLPTTFVAVQSGAWGGLTDLAKGPELRRLKVNIRQRPGPQIGLLKPARPARRRFHCQLRVRAPNWRRPIGRGSMGSNILRPDSGDAASPPTQEVEFALMLSRMIDSVEKHPEYLRAAIYELARNKLKEQYNSERFADVRRRSKSLEIAIQGVEAFNKKKEGTEAALVKPDATQEKSLISTHASRQDVIPVVRPISPAMKVPVSSPERSPARLRRFKAAVLAIGLTVVFLAVSLHLLRNKGNIVINQPTSILPKVATLASPQSASTATDPRPATPSPALPSSFGIYAVSDDKLYELDLLPGRAPDARVAISSLITTTSRAMLPDGPSSSIVGIQRPMRPIKPKFGSSPKSKGKRALTRTAGRSLPMSMTIGPCGIFRPRIERRRQRTIRICTKSVAKIQLPHWHLVATRLSSKASPTISVLQVRSLILGNAWSDWWRPTVNSIPSARSSS